jgi:hypothetical protein
VAADPINDDNPIEAILLTGFPNPERIGCPDPAVIEALGLRKIPRGDPAWHHIWNCSPCFGAFKIIRDKRLAEAERRHARKRLLRRSAFLAAVVLCAILIGVFISHRRPAEVETAVIPIDLFDVGPTRGAASLNSQKPIAELPRKLDELRITLPRFSPNARYIIGILKSPSENTAIALGSAMPIAGKDKTRLLIVLKLDLSNAEVGRYFLGTRLQQQGQETADFYYPVVIESDKL